MDAEQAPSSPRTAFKAQLEHLAFHHVRDRHDGHILTKDLLLIFEEYERQYDVLLLTDPQKQSILPYCLRNPDLEMSTDDIVRLLTLVMPPSQPLPRPRTPEHFDCTHSAVEGQYSSKVLIHPPQGDNTQEDDSPVVVSEKPAPEDDRVKKYRHSVDRLKLSEQRLASLTRDNEDRIVELQNRVDDMSQEVVKQKKEISEYKHKEKSSLDQICALEEHISAVERSETDQKQVFLSLRKLFEEKCEETLALQGMLKQKELDLGTTESFLNKFHREFFELMAERDRLAGLQSSLERELETSHLAHQQLAEQRMENMRLKEIINELRCDLDVARNEQNDTRIDCNKATLRMELDQQDEPYQADPTSQANETLEDIEQMKHELSHIRLALDSENRSLISQLADLRTRRKEGNEAGPSSYETPTQTTPAITMEKRQSTLPRQRKTDYAKRRSKIRVVQDLSVSRAAVIGHSSHVAATSQSLLPNRHQRTISDKAVPNTVTFALYTLLVYIFGIVTSTFLIENGPPGSWEQAIVAAASTPQGQRSKLLEIVLYWIEKLLFEGEGGIPLQ